MKTLSYCPGTVRDIDPEWNHSDAESWNDIFNDEVSGQGTEDGFDNGVRPLLWELHENGLETRSSNLACSGSLTQFDTGIIFERDSEIIEDVTADLRDKNLPDGWIVSTTYDDSIRLAKENGSATRDDYNEDRKEACWDEFKGDNLIHADPDGAEAYRECIQEFSRSVDPVEDYGFPTPEERQEVDRIFIETVRENL